MRMTQTAKIYSFVRKSKDGKNNMLFVCNFTPVARPDYRVGVPKKKTYKLVLDSDVLNLAVKELKTGILQSCEIRVRWKSVFLCISTFRLWNCSVQILSRGLTDVVSQILWCFYRL